MPCSTCKHCKKKLQQKNKSQETSDTDTTNDMASHYSTNDESKENEDPLAPSRAWIKNVGPGSCKKLSTANITRSSQTRSTTKSARQLITTKAVAHHAAVDITTMRKNEAHSHSAGIERFKTIETSSDDNNCEGDTLIGVASAIQTTNDDTVKHVNHLRSGLKNAAKPICRSLGKQASANSIILRCQNSEWTSIPAMASKPKQADAVMAKKPPFNDGNQNKRKSKTARQLIATNEIDVDITAMMENTHLHSTRIETSDDIRETDSTTTGKASSIQTKIDDTMKVLCELESGLGSLAKPIDPTPEIREQNNLTMDWTLPNNNNAILAISPTQSETLVNVYMTEDKLNKLMRDGLIQRRNGHFYYD